ncbi:cytochrome C oxidase assembly protein [Sulfuricella sp. T08]|uniref:cytochrome c oxidase assembly protein n=1 Tax=Sulfuricella sp. T08 TaxID=1632857 RepID=UPI000617A0F8|nr:cytochrome c oxidase assembly protein [Sulfuricella sp. T08]GAO36572.1 cytochrome C oxidase assembly protein [Sulfuricella sp. T08]
MNGEELRQANKRLALKLGAGAVVALAFGFALVPLYNVLCEATGLNGKTNAERARPAAVKVDKSRWVTVQFTGTVMPGLSWAFYPKVASMRVHPGEITRVSYYAKNPTNQTIVGQAVPSITPGQAAQHFVKLDCFCFKQQALEPGAEKEMGLTFIISPELSKEVGTVTLSYAFFPAVKGS